MAERKGDASVMRRVLVFSTLFRLAASQSVDGGRSELPGMKRDIFDQVQGQKGRPPPRGKGPPDCPKSDGWSPFTAIAFTSSHAFVKLSPTEEKCTQLVSVGGVNLTQLINASRTCGPAGEFKRRIAENMSSIFFQGGFDWVRSENETIEVVTEDGTFEAHVNEDNYAVMLACWRYGCGCEQANNPIMRGVLIAMLVIAVGGLGYDSLKVLWLKIRGQKPPKHVECKNGHRMAKVKLTRTHYCDICGCSGTQYQCGVSCNYDMCKKCYGEQKVKIKAQMKEWLEKHPEDRPKGKKGEEEDKDDEDEKDEKETEEKEEEANKSETEKSEKSEKSGTEAEADTKCPTPKTDTEAESEKDKDNDDEPDATNDTNESKDEEEKAAEIPP